MNNQTRLSLTTFLMLLPAVFLFAGNQSDWPSVFLKGWQKSLKGGGFGYHSPDPAIGSSLLLRSVDSLSYIEWETEPIPATLPQGNVQFIWMFGIDANPDIHVFKLFFNGRYCLEFSNPPLSEKKTWTVKGVDGISLTFRATMIDKYGDLMGYAFLEVPSSCLLKGKPQVVKVAGESSGSQRWYMTFEAGIEEKISLVQQEAVIRGTGTKQFLGVAVSFIHLGEAVKAAIEQPGGKKTSLILQPGYSVANLLFSADSISPKETVVVEIEGQPALKKEISLHPVRHWTIYLVQHTHTDIGYTRPQTEILPEHLRYIDYALDYCDQTDSFPDAAKFRWTCETSWAVNEYLKSRPAAQVERLKRRAMEGRIELTGLYLNSSDLSDEATIAASLQPVSYFRELGFKVKACMQDDINGVPWCLPDYLADAGVEYLNMGQNTDRALKPFDRPTTFWWESPSGKRIMVNRPEHYMFGNSMGVITGREALEKNLFSHLVQISLKGYPFDEYAIQFSGYMTDNSPPSTRACNVVKEWNETYAWPQLRLATVSEFLQKVKKDHASELPVIKGAWPDWWIDGFGSSALTTAYTRMAHSDFIANSGLMTLAALMNARLSPHIGMLHQQIFDDLAFYDEHTFGAAESITDPECENSVVQLGEKLSYTWEAVKKNRILREEVMGNIQSRLPTYGRDACVAVINTLNWNRRASVNLYIDQQVLPADRQFRIFDSENNAIPAQSWSERPEGSYITLFTGSIPPMGYSSYRISVSGEARKSQAPKKFEGTLGNKWYTLRIDPASGRILSLYDKEAGRELCDASAKYGFGEFIYETLGKNREQVSNRRLDMYKREVWERIKISGITEGEVWSSITLSGQLPACAGAEGIQCEIRLYNAEKKVEFRYSMKKLPVTDPEGVYISFPFSMMKKNRVSYEVAGALVEAGKDQINGSATDWQGIQNYISLCDDSCNIVFVSPEIPVVQLGDLNIGKFAPTVTKPQPVIYSWVLNNYWTTNFLASQSGELKWTYQITSGRDLPKAEAARFAWSERIPLLARVLPANGKENSKTFKQGWIGELPADILLINAIPAADQKGVIYQLRETAGRTSAVDPKDFYTTAQAGKPGGMNNLKISLVNVLGEEMKKISGEFSIAPLETVFIKLSWDE
ncbi:MAG: glycoside hydrolase family 38 C-terminal domain-containing protein [Bacteroidota bacterium]